ncbi:Hypothetical predicted protein [Olea europaea subsp. europaea]|uniref:DUF1985 domain-containing protein n=1 Tax=Olea europaea subsp. europaea TaxID=158383 RepID=A0A8S0STB5_OLEEU|nr:Hypothetical predicted protein [Olea europaea subsp. europaea]
MDFEFLIPEDAQLRAHISQRSNLKYIKIVMDHFDERQREDFCNSPLGYLTDVPDIQFSAQLIPQLVFRTVRTEKMNELWFNVQDHLMRFDLEEYAAVTRLRCGLFPEGDDFDRLIETKMLKERYRRLLHGFRGNFARKFQQVKRRKEKEITCTVHDFSIAIQLHVCAILRPTDVETEQPYLYILVPYDDPPVPVLDDIVRTVLAPQFHSLHADSGIGGQDDDSDGQSGSDRDGDDSEDTGESSTPPAAQVPSPMRGPTTYTRPVGTSASSLTRGKMDELLLDQRILFEMRLWTVKLEIEQHVTFECTRLREFIAALVAPPPPTTAPCLTGAIVQPGLSGCSP